MRPAKDVQVMIEARSHVPFDTTANIIELEKAVASTTPVLHLDR